MRLLICFAAAWMLTIGAALAAEPAIKKVLPHYLDHEGRHTLSPSLYERDAYQAFLRNHPEARSALRFDILCRSQTSTNLQLRLELRGTKDSKPTRLEVESGPLRHDGGREWHSITIPAKTYDQVGRMLAWKVTLMEKDKVLAAKNSFLWQSEGRRKGP